MNETRRLCTFIKVSRGSSALRHQPTAKGKASRYLSDESGVLRLVGPTISVAIPPCYEARNWIAVSASLNDHAGVAPPPEATLDSLAELFAMLEQAGLQFWLAGGWAVDFHAGRVTRPHTDVDLVVHHGDKEELHNLLLNAGFKTVEDSEPDAEMIYQRDNFKVDLSFIVESDDGTVVSPGWEHWPWPPGSFSSGIRQLSGVSCHVISSSTLLTSKRDYETHVGDAPRPRDLADIQVLESRAMGPDV